MNFENNIPENESFEETVKFTQTMDNLESENIPQAENPNEKIERKKKKKKSKIILLGLGFIILIVFLLIFTGSSDSSGSSGSSYSSSSYKSSYNSDDLYESHAIDYVKRALADRIKKDAYKYGGDVSSIKYTIASTNRTGDNYFTFYGRISLYDKYGNYIDTKNFTAEVDVFNTSKINIEIN